jgi:hypothetical protein
MCAEKQDPRCPMMLKIGITIGLQMLGSGAAADDR